MFIIATISYPALNGKESGRDTVALQLVTRGVPWPGQLVPPPFPPPPPPPHIHTHYRILTELSSERYLNHFKSLKRNMGKLILYAIYIYKLGKYYYNLSFYVKIYLLAGWDELGAFRSLHLPQKNWQIHFPEIGFPTEQSIEHS